MTLLPPQRLETLPHLGTITLFPGLSVATMPRAEGLIEVNFAAQPNTIAIYVRRSRHLQANIAPGLTDRRIRARSVMVVPMGLETRWVYNQPIYDRSPGLQTLHLRLTDAFSDVMECTGRATALAPGMNLAIPGLAAGLERALSAFQSPEAFRFVALQSAACAAAALLLDPKSAQVVARASTMTPRRRRALSAYVEDQLAEDVTLAGMAETVGLSPFHFIRVFKAATGRTPYAYVVERRIARVKAHLVTSNQPLTEIALRCGFASQSHMTEVFRRQTGETPGRWRARYRDRPELAQVDLDDPAAFRKE